MILVARALLQKSKRGQFCKRCHNELSLGTKREDKWGKIELCKLLIVVKSPGQPKCFRQFDRYPTEKIEVLLGQ